MGQHSSYDGDEDAAHGGSAGQAWLSQSGKLEREEEKQLECFFFWAYGAWCVSSSTERVYFKTIDKFIT